MSDTPAPSSVAFLDRAEVETVLAPAVEPAAPAQPLLHASATKDGATPRVTPYDFRQPAFLSEAELARLRLLHEDFIRYLGARLSLQLRMEFGLKLAGLTAVTYAQFVGSLANPSHLCLFKVEPLVGVGLLDFSPRLALTIADRLLGGRGQAAKAARPLTEIEIALLEDVIGNFLEEWCGQWKHEPPLHAKVIGHENSGRFLQTAPKDAIMLALEFEATLGECTEPLKLGVPYYLIEPVMKRMQVNRRKDSTVTTTEKRATWQPAFDQIALPLRAEWSDLELTVRELASLRVGDVIELPAALFQETRVLLNGTPKFIGSVGHDADRVAVQLTRKLPREDSHHVPTDGR